MKILGKKLKVSDTVVASSGGYYYAYGWGIDAIPLGNTAELLEAIGHGGGINGFNTQLTRITSDKSFIVLLNNTGRAPLNEMTKAIAAIILINSISLLVSMRSHQSACLLSYALPYDRQVYNKHQ